MSNKILNLEPKAIWKHFYSLTQIPRPSKKEGEIIEFMKKWGEDHGFETIVDEIGNVIIKKPATPGMENRQGVILQGHLDMVPQKNSEIDHDFEKDPIDVYIDGEWVTAKGTTLGADNGMGVAAAMAVLESDSIPHGPIEALCTVDEETGMTGAVNLKPGLLDGNILINMDSEDEGELYIGCAGGVDTNVKYKYTEEHVSGGIAAFKIIVKGLKGGHSGLDIHLGKGNACLILNKVMLNASDKFGLRLAHIDAGSLRNAIPREAFATVVLPKENEELFLSYIGETEKNEKETYKDIDPDLAIVAEKADLPANVIDKETQSGLFNGVANCPNGVIEWDKNMPDVVETSSNLAIIKSDNGTINISVLTRSAVDDERDRVAKKIADNFKAYGAEVTHSGAYPGWKPNVDSAILETMKEVYNNKFGKVPEVKVIHAGLECGILGATYTNWDMISFGPTIRFPHSPDEKVNIETVKKFWEFLLEILKNVPEK
ncbi:MAG: aminoacyl-histidine dipeptidase [Bacteroidetes bacterium]|nr:aminoacyl-histidine dipeptidase [Bacteroidota bacterium]MBL7103799.1 aminoacyl-histidine dipeptidase [Bacteroidales bacterium]